MDWAPLPAMIPITRPDLPSLAELRDTDTIARELNLSLDLEPAPKEAAEAGSDDGEGDGSGDGPDGEDPGGSEVADRAVGD